MEKLFLSLNDAVEIAYRQFDIDIQLARQEFEQKCYISDNQYAIGFCEGVDSSIEALKELRDNVRFDAGDDGSHLLKIKNEITMLQTFNRADVISIINKYINHERG